MIVTIKHTKAIGYCNDGLRHWFQGRDISFREFVLHGVTEEWLIAQDDAMASKLLAHARMAEAAAQSPAEN